MEEISRRAFLLLTASAGISLASRPGKKFVDKLIPYVIPMQDATPGVRTFYSTTCRECPAGCGMRACQIDGRIIKAEGNPSHPVNGGVPRPILVQGHYDPDRLRNVSRKTASSGMAPSDWRTAVEEVGELLGKRRGKIVLISDLQTGSLAELMERFADAFGSRKPAFYEPFNYEPLREAHATLFGFPAIPDYRLDVCRLIVSFTADFLESWISPVQFASRFAEMHSLRDGQMGRMVYVGPRFSMTAANADDYLQVPPGGECGVALAILDAMIEKGWTRRDMNWLSPFLHAMELPSTIPAERIAELARLFAQVEGSVALAGPVGAGGPVAKQMAMAAALLNYAAGRIGRPSISPVSTR